MSPTARLNLFLSSASSLLAGASGAAFTYRLWGPAFAALLDRAFRAEGGEARD